MNECGGTSQLGRIPVFPDRELPLPSPSANLVGIWKGATATIDRWLLPTVFFRSVTPSREILQEVFNETWLTRLILGRHSQIYGAGIRRHRHQPHLHPHGHFRPHRTKSPKSSRHPLPRLLDHDHTCHCRICLAGNESGPQGRRGDHRTERDSGPPSEAGETVGFRRLPLVCRGLSADWGWGYHAGNFNSLSR